MGIAALAISAACALEKVDSNLTIYSFIPPEATQGWKIELFELSREIPSHYHKIRRQILLVAEGELGVSIGNRESTILKSGELMVIDPGNIHSLAPLGTARFFDIDFPGFYFPEDVFDDIPKESYVWKLPSNKAFSVLDARYFGVKLDQGAYSVYEIANGEVSQQKWSLALLEIESSPKHFHRIEKEIFVVVEGLLDIEIDGEHKLLKAGESITIFPYQIHQLKSASTEPVRVLCFSFPAFDPKDMYLMD